MNAACGLRHRLLHATTRSLLTPPTPRVVARGVTSHTSRHTPSTGGHPRATMANAVDASPPRRYIDIGANLTDSMFQAGPEAASPFQRRYLNHQPALPW